MNQHSYTFNLNNVTIGNLEYIEHEAEYMFCNDSAEQRIADLNNVNYLNLESCIKDVISQIKDVKQWLNIDKEMKLTIVEDDTDKVCLIILI